VSAPQSFPMQRDHLPFLDAIRGFAILSVMAYHSLSAAYGIDQLPWKGWFHDFQVPASFLLFLPVTLGWLGVPIFFVVSGFCIHLSHQRSKSKAWSVYFARRFFRIYPPYLVALLLFSFLWPWTVLHINSLSGIFQFFTHLLLIHNFFPTTFWAINGSFWTLAIEAQLYLLYPLLLLLVHRMGWIRALWITGLLELGMRLFQGIFNVLHNTSAQTWVSHGEPFFYSFTLGSPFYFWFCWSIGAYAADCFLKKEPLPLRGLPIWIFPALLVLVTSFKPIISFGYVCAALSAVSLISWFLSPRSTAPRNSSAGFQHLLSGLGTISFSAYLFHQPIINLVPQLLENGYLPNTLGPLPRLLLITLSWIPILLLSWFSYHWIEAPSIALGKWVLTKFQKNNPALL
jgi:peptidoglycan/LPS O-acetylase OafA/YrhL